MWRPMTWPESSSGSDTPTGGITACRCRFNFDRILLSKKSVWFAGKTREELCRQAAERALEKPVEPWGHGRGILLNHLLFNGKPPRFLGFDRGPVTLAGSPAAPNQGQIHESGGRLTTFAPSLRLIADLATDEMHTNMIGGPSDRRFSQWCCSDLSNWLGGRYKTLSTRSSGKRHSFP